MFVRVCVSDSPTAALPSVASCWNSVLDTDPSAILDASIPAALLIAELSIFVIVLLFAFIVLLVSVAVLSEPTRVVSASGSVKVRIVDVVIPDSSNCTFFVLSITLYNIALY